MADPAQPNIPMPQVPTSQAPPGSSNQPSMSGTPAEPENSSSRSWLKIGLVSLAVLILAGVAAAFYLGYLKLPGQQATKSVPSVTPTPTPVLPTPTPEPTLDQQVQNLDQDLQGLDQSLAEVDNGINDKQGDLSEK